uniref:Uncharacterized protein n=1 Tax=Oryza meridionalis TaxID=40149 RepID=A0A0E0CLF4_9ORYZ
MVRETRSGNVDHLYGVRCGSDRGEVGTSGGASGVDTRWLRRSGTGVGWSRHGHMVGRWGAVIDIAGRELERQHEEVAWRDKRGAWRRHRRRVTWMRTIAGASCWAKGQQANPFGGDAVHEASMAQPCIGVLE